MHVLHLNASNQLRGGQYQIILLIRALQNAGHRNTLLTDPAGPLWKRAEELDLRLIPSTRSALRRLSRQVDLVHAHDARAHTLAVLANSRPLIVSRRVAFPIRRGLFSRWKYRRADRYLAVSYYVASELRSAGVPPEQIDVVYDGVELPAPGENASSPASFRVVALASKDPQKGRDLIEQAAALARLPVDFSDDIYSALHDASVFLYITRSEGLGSAALLAMGLGVPVIASRVGGLPEAVRDEQEGLLVNNDPEEIRRSLERLRDDPGLARQLGRRGRLRVEEMFTAQHLAERTLAAYGRALAGK